MWIINISTWYLITVESVFSTDVEIVYQVEMKREAAATKRSCAKEPFQLLQTTTKIALMHSFSYIHFYKNVKLMNILPLLANAEKTPRSASHKLQLWLYSFWWKQGHLALLKGHSSLNMTQMLLRKANKIAPAHIWTIYRLLNLIPYFV